MIAAGRCPPPPLRRSYEAAVLPFAPRLGHRHGGGGRPLADPKEILRNIKLIVADGTATLIGTDQEVGIRHVIPEISTTSTGEVLLPTARIGAILREVQDDTVSLEVTEDALWVRTAHSEFRLSIENPAEFPDVAAFNEENYHVVPGKTLKQGIQRTLFAADVESTRYALGGVLMGSGRSR